jgi:iron complex outermembrane receptor protein
MAPIPARFLMSAAAGALILSTTSLARAQAPASAPTQPGGGQASPQSGAITPAGGSEQIQEVVVTAEKRVSTAQKTPITMSVISGAEVKANGIDDVNDLPNVAPTLNISQVGGDTLIAIRGISSRDYTENGNPDVAVSIDNFYLQSANELNVAFFDLNRIEVLRGPQGTLYGRNSAAGAVNIETAKPTGTPDASFSQEFGSYNNLISEGMINQPLGDNVFLRVAFQTHNRDGYRDNGSLATNGGSVTKNGDDADTQAFRVHLLYEPNSNFDALLTGEYTHVGGVGAVQKGVLYSDVVGSGSSATLNVGSPTHFPLNTQGYQDITTENVRAAVHDNLGPVTLSYYGGFAHQVDKNGNDQDGGVAYNYGFPSSNTINTQNQEFRVTTNLSDRFGFQAGAYYFANYEPLLTYFQYTATAPATDVYTFSYHANATSYAGFIQGYYNILKNLKVEFGTRYTQDKKSEQGYDIEGGVYTAVNGRYKGGAETYHAALDWQRTPINLFYVKYDTGFKSGGFENGSIYGPENIGAYEIGTKNEFLHRRLQVNLDAFYDNYSNLQVQINNPTTAISEIVNAGQATTYGYELQTEFLPTAKDRFDFEADYLHARYINFQAAVGSVNVQYAGNELPQAPQWSLVAGYQHDFALSMGELTARIQTRYQDKSYFTPRNYNTEAQDPYTKTDILLTFVPTQSRFSISAYVRNLEDSTILTNSTEAGYAGGYLVQFAEPRTFGFRVAYHWH